MKVLLVKSGGERKRFDQLFPDLGLADAAGSALAAGAEARIVDLDVVGRLPSDLVAVVDSWKPEVIGFKLYSTNSAWANRLAGRVRSVSPKATIVGGGPQPTLFGAHLLEGLSEFDLLVIGPAEPTFGLVLRAIEHSASLDSIPSIAYRSYGKVIQTPASPAHLPAVTAPAWHLIDFSAYFPVGLVNLARGCPCACTFCAHNAAWQAGGHGRSSLVVLSPLEVEANLQTLVSAGGLRKFAVVDSFPNTIELEEFAARVGRLTSRPRWLSFGYVGALRTRLRYLRESGCMALWYGVETGNKELRGLLGKKFSNSQAIEQLRETRKAGIWGGAGFMFGLPRETDEAFQESVSLSPLLEADSISWSPFTLDPGTAMSKDPGAFGIAPVPEWERKIACLPEGVTPADTAYFSIDGEWNNQLCLRRGKAVGYTGGGEDRMIANDDYLHLTVCDAPLTPHEFLTKLDQAFRTNRPETFQDLRSLLV